MARKNHAPFAISVARVLCVFASIWLAGEGAAQEVKQEILQYRSAWDVIPEVRQPTFNYGEVHNGKLIAEAAESLDYLSVDNLIIGNIRGNNAGNLRSISGAGYQVIVPGGEIFYLNNIENPTCGVQIVAQQIQSNDGILISHPGAGTSSVYIGEVNFGGCR